jgi:hypothetical protein
MGWGGVDAIPRRAGESSRQAVDRVYAGGRYIELVDGVPVMGTIPGEAEPHDTVTADDHAWTERAIGLLERQRPGWQLVDSFTPRASEWPRWQVLEHPTAPMWVTVDIDSATFRYARSDETPDDEWRFWWRTLRAFARLPAAIFEPDTSDLIVMSLSTAIARARYDWP